MRPGEIFAALFLAVTSAAAADVTLPVPDLEPDDRLVTGDFDGDGHPDIAIGITTAPGGRVDWLRGTATSWELQPVAAGSPAAPIGGSIVNAGDVNGDGFDDLLVGVGIDAVRLYPGSSSGPSDVGWTFTLSETANVFGVHPAHGGDLDGDGFYDVVIGMSGYDEDTLRQGGIFVFYGGAGFGGDHVESDADWSVRGAPDGTIGSEFGVHIAGGGDVDFDGLHDLVVGDPSSNFEGMPRRGAIHIFFGASDGVDTGRASIVMHGADGEALGGGIAMLGDATGTGAVDVLSHVDGGFEVLTGSTQGLARGEQFVDDRTAYPAGDYDGDGFADVVLTGGGQEGAVLLGSTDVNFDIAHPLPGSPAGRAARALVCRAGGLAVLFAATSGAVHGYTTPFNAHPDYLSRLELNARGIERRDAWPIGDVDGDGLADFAVTYRDDDVALTDIYLGRFIEGDGDGPALTLEEQSSYIAGGDVNGDGYADFLFGATTAGEAGELRVHYGSPTGIDASPDVVLSGDEATLAFGEKVQPLGDVNGDGSCDIVVTACDENPCYVMVVYGSDEGLSGDVLYGWRLETDVNRYAGGDVNGDGYADLTLVGHDGLSIWFGSPAGFRADPNTTGPDYHDPAVPFADVQVSNVSGSVHDDVVIVGFTGTIVVLEGGPDGPEAYDGAGARPLAPSSGAHGLGDLDGDGFDDMLLYTRGEGEIILADTLGATGTSPVYAAIPVGDVNADGRGDYVAFPDDTGELQLVIGGGRSSWNSAWTAEARSSSGVPLSPGAIVPSDESLVVRIATPSPAGRGRARIELEVKAAGVPFDGEETFTSAWFEWTNVYAPHEVMLPQLPPPGAYRWRARMRYDSHLADGAWHGFEGVAYTNIAFRVGDGSVPVEPTGDPAPGPSPVSFAVSAPSPNPLASTTVVRFATSAPMRLRADVFDVAGRRVRRLLDRRVPSGAHRVAWDGTDARGVEVASGVYVVVVTSGAERVARRVVVAR